MSGGSGATAIHDVGYRPYEGERRGPAWSTLALAIHGIQRALGIKRAFRHKVLPAITLILAFVPAIVFVGLAAFLDADFFDEAPLPTYGEYYGFIAFALILFASFVAPEVLCTDRRTGMLGLYLASPLDRSSYLIAKTAAVAVVLSVMTTGPLLLMLVAYTLQGFGPSFFGFFEDLGRIVLSGGVLALYFTAWSLAISSLTPRRGIASAAIVITLLVSAIVAGVLVENTSAPAEVELIDIAGTGFEFARRVLQEPPFDDVGLDVVSSGLVAVTVVASTVLLSGFMQWRYRGIDAER